jgi:hypothetical protein
MSRKRIEEPQKNTNNLILAETDVKYFEYLEN